MSSASYHDDKEDEKNFEELVREFLKAIKEGEKEDEVRQ